MTYDFRTHLRSQSVLCDPDVIIQQEKKRQKALYFQEAIRQQLLEKEQKHKEDREQQLEEEEKLEQKVRKQQEMERFRIEEEQMKQKVKEVSISILIVRVCNLILAVKMSS